MSNIGAGSQSGEDPNDASNVGQAEATGTSIGGSEGAPDTGSAMGGDPNFGQAAAANAAAAATEATGGWDFPDPVGGWATSAPMTESFVGPDYNNTSAPQDPLASAMAIVDAAIANTGMPAVGLPGMGLQGFGFTDAQNQAYGQDQGGMTAGVGLSGPGLGTGPGTSGYDAWGSDITGPGYADPNMTAFDASQYGMLSTPQQTVTENPLDDLQTMYGADQFGASVGLEDLDNFNWGQGIADVQAQAQAALQGQAQAEAQEADEVGADLAAQDEAEFGADQRGRDVGLNFGPGRGTNPDPDNFVGWGEDITAPPAPPNTVDIGLQAALDAPQDSPAPQGTVGTLDSLAQDEAQKQRTRDEETAKAEDAMMMARDKAVDKEAFEAAAWDFEDKKGKINSMTPQDKAYAEASRQLNKAGWALFSMITGRNPTEAEKAEIAAANKAADIAQTAMEDNVSTGEEQRALQNFKAKYPWASQMSDFEVQAYINSPQLLKLKLDNMKISEQMNTNTALSSNDVRALWAPAGAGLPGASLSPQG